MSGPVLSSSPAREGIAVVALSGRLGEVVVGDGDIVIGSRAEPVAVVVENTSAWPVVITSHFHLFEANRHLRFDRRAAFGMHLDVVAGGSVRFEPGQVLEVGLVPYAGERAVFGFNGLTNAVLGTGAAFEAERERAVARARAAGYLDSAESDES